MANNRMWLVNDRLKRRVMLGKYSPSNGWISPNNVEGHLDAVFDEPDPPTDTQDLASFGPMDWRVVYEMNEPADAVWKTYTNAFGETV